MVSGQAGCFADDVVEAAAGGVAGGASDGVAEDGVAGGASTGCGEDGVVDGAGAGDASAGCFGEGVAEEGSGGGAAAGVCTGGVESGDAAGACAAEQRTSEKQTVAARMAERRGRVIWSHSLLVERLTLKDSIAKASSS